MPELCNICNRPERKGDFGADFGACRVLTYVRPHDAALQLPRARMVFADQVQIKAACSKALCCGLVFPIPSHDRCAKLLLALFRSDASRLTVGLCRRSRSPVIFALDHQRPDNARHLVGQRDADQHRRFAR